MSFHDRAAILALVAAIATPAPAWAMSGPGGCNGLPEYYRALGTLQGLENACNMSMEDARRIVAAYGNPAGVAPPVAPAPARRHHRRAPQS